MQTRRFWASFAHLARTLKHARSRTLWSSADSIWAGNTALRRYHGIRQRAPAVCKCSPLQGEHQWRRRVHELGKTKRCFMSYVTNIVYLVQNQKDYIAQGWTYTSNVSSILSCPLPWEIPNVAFIFGTMLRFKSRNSMQMTSQHRKSLLLTHVYTLQLWMHAQTPNWESRCEISAQYQPQYCSELNPETIPLTKRSHWKLILIKT